MSAIVLGAMLPTGAGAAVVPPTSFPGGVNLDASAYTLQFAGANREGTAAAIALDAATSGSHTGGYPFQGATPAADPGAPLYGPTTCPKTLVLAADDTPADALAASSLDGVAALKVTDLSGNPITFDTRGAALLLTESGRSGATQLDPTTTSAITKIKAACTGTINGIVLGGTNAIPDTMEAEFKSSLNAVARLGGTDRDDTARIIASAVFTSDGSKLPTVNSFPTATEAGTAGAIPLPKALFLAEDQTGADALAVGAVAARFGVPVLLTSTNTLPAATANALASLAPANIVILGGTAAVSDAVASSAQQVVGASTTVTRIAGPDRYATSVAIAEELLNLYPQYVAKFGAGGYSDQMVGIARDEGTAAGGNHVGWPDALASAYYLATLGETSTAPSRVAPAVEVSRTDDGQGTTTTTALTPVACGSSGSQCSDDVPLLLTTGSSLAPEVDAYLRAMYPSGGSYKTGAKPKGANDGGFGFVFGGSASVTAAATATLASDLSGQTYVPSSASDLNPSSTAGGVFYTTIPIAPFTAGVPDTSTAMFVGDAASSTTPNHDKICAMPGALTGTAATEAVNEKGGAATTNPVDYFSSASPYPAGMSLGSCVDMTTASPASVNDSAQFYGVSLSGNATQPTAISYAPAATLAINALGNTPSGTSNTGDIFTPIATGSSETESVTYQAIPLTSAVYKGKIVMSATANLSLQLTRAKAANGADVVSWTGTLTVLSGTAQAFTATIGEGIATTTPPTAAPIVGTITLLGVYSAPGLGGITMTMTPPLSASSAPVVGGIEASGDA